MPQFVVSCGFAQRFVAFGLPLMSGLVAMPVHAQVLPDGSLGAEASRVRTEVRQGVQTDLIDQGALRGTALFHSFEQFDIAAGRASYFETPLGVEQILSRVTGGTASQIDGTLGVLGDADLFLLNPQGVLFGPGARLDLAGAFTAAAAESLSIGPELAFNGVEPGPVPLLDVQIVPGLQPGQVQFGQLTGTVETAGQLELRPNQVLTLLGETVRNRGELRVPGGQVMLLGDRVSLTDQALIDVSATEASATGDGGTVLMGGEFQGRWPGSVSLPNARRSYVGPEARILANAGAKGEGGRVIVWADRDTRFYGEVSARGGAVSGDGGFVEVSGKQALTFGGQVDASAVNGQVGQLLLDPTNIEVVGLLGFGTFDLSLVDEFADADLDNEATRVSAAAINLSTADVVLQASSQIEFNAEINTINNVGITAQAGEIIMVNNRIQTNGGEIRLTTGDSPFPIAGEREAINVVSGDIRSGGGDIFLQSGGAVLVKDSTILTDVGAGTGDSGDLDIQANSLTLEGTGQIGSASFGRGNAGDTRIQAQNIEINSPDDISQTLTGITVSSGKDKTTTGNAGTVLINSQRLSVTNGGQIQAVTFGAGEGGSIDITSNNIVLSGTQGTAPSGILSGAQNDSSGNSGSISINANELVIRDGGTIDSTTAGLGNAGKISITAKAIDLTGMEASFSSSINASSKASLTGKSGDISIISDNIRVRQGASIISNSFKSSGGSLDILSNQKLEIGPQSLISAIAFEEGDGGDIRVVTPVLELGGGLLPWNHKLRERLCWKCWVVHI